MLLGLTGGVATGKSTFTRLLPRAHPFMIFDADACVHELLSTDGDIIRAVSHEFSLPQHEPPIPIDRALLRQRVFSNPSTRRRLEVIIHPVVRQRWMAEAYVQPSDGSIHSLLWCSWFPAAVVQLPLRSSSNELFSQALFLHDILGRHPHCELVHPGRSTHQRAGASQRTTG